MRFKRALILGAVLLSLGSIFTQILFQTHTASAQTSSGLEIIDKVHIKYKGEIYTDINPYDSTDQFQIKPRGDCTPSLTITNLSSARPSVEYNAVTKDSFGNCVDHKSRFTIDSSTPGFANRLVTAYRLDDDTVFVPIPGNAGGYDSSCVNVGGPGDSAWYAASPAQYVRVKPGEDGYAPNKYFLNGNPVHKESYLVTKNDSRQADIYSFACEGHDKLIGTLSFANNGSKTIPNSGVYGSVTAQPPGSGSSSGNGGTPEASCESEGGALGWIMCPVTRLIDDALNWVDTQIQALLEIDKTAYTNSDLHSSWAQIRNIAYIILVPIMLVMVISTALGFSFVDAYTVRRALPRMVIAIIFIALSWEITTFLIAFSNVVGAGVMGILTAPFRHDPPITQLTLSSLYGGSIIQGALLLPLAGAAIIALWLFGGTLLLFASIGFLVLLLRQISIVALMLAAPLAILAWIFPGNDRLWKSWWSIFSKLLMMFPLIMALIAVGRIFGVIIHDNGAGGAGLQGSILKPLSILIVWMIPYALIPLTFRFAGGFFATITGMVNDRTKGIFDRQKQSRANKLERTAGGKMFKGGGATGVRAGLNTAAAAVLASNKAGLKPTNWRRNVGNAMAVSARQQIEKAEKENPDYAMWSGNDTLNGWANATNNEGELRKALLDHDVYSGDTEQMERDIRRVEAVRRSMSASAFKQMTFLHATAGGTFYGRTQNKGKVNAAGESMEYTPNWAAAMASSAGNDDAALAYIASQGKSAAMNAGRGDQGQASFGTIFESARKVRGGQINADQAMQDIYANAYEAAGASTLLHPSMKPDTVENLSPQVVKSVQGGVTAGNAGDTNEFARQMASLASVYESMNGTNPKKAQIVRDEVLSKEIDFGSLSPEMKTMLAPAMAERQPDGSITYKTSGTITYAKAIEAMRTNDQFREYHREFQSQLESAAVGAQQTQPGPGDQAGAAPQGPQ